MHQTETSTREAMVTELKRCRSFVSSPRQIAVVTHHVPHVRLEGGEREAGRAVAIALAGDVVALPGDVLVLCLLLVDVVAVVTG